MACRAPVFQKVTRIMRRGSTKRLGLRFLTVAIFFELCASVTSAAAFRFSFLEEPPILEDTCQLLKETGFSEGSVITFKKLVEYHNKNGNRVDRTKFPAARKGYYQFR